MRSRIARARAEDIRVCIAVIDLDHFKRYNDTFGHPAGDRLLREAVAAWIDVLGNVWHPRALRR